MVMIEPTAYSMLTAVFAGETTAAIAERFGVAPSTVRRRMQQLEQEVPGLDYAVFVAQDVHRRQRQAVLCA